MRRNGWLERDLVGDTSAHEGATRLWLAAAARAAIRDPRAAVIAALAVAGACLTGLSAFLLAIPLTYTLRFAIALLGGRTRQGAFRESRERPIALPSPMSFADQDARRLVERLERVRWAIENAALAGPSGSAFAVGGLVQEVPQIERDVIILAARIEYLGRFLSSAPSTGLQAEVIRLDQDRERAKDAATRDGLQRLLRRCREHLDTLGTLGARRSAALRTAEELLRTLEQIPARIVSLQMTRVDACDVRAVEAGQRADAVTEGFAGLERTISSPPAPGATLQS
ncbi:MAG TPA: hypothetical protein VHO06_26315 [Polyangia bacterium]|nr:hypothetical protein [Polyangia bacterium]